jgi:hypothetical protein
MPTLGEFLQTQMVPRFYDLVKAAESRLTAMQREVDDLKAASGTIAWEISAAPPIVHYANIADGAMSAAMQPASDPFMTVAQSAEDWVRFSGSMAGLFAGDSRRPFGKSRIDRVRAIRGAMRFVLTGLPDAASWSCTLYFGPGPRPAEPQTTITIPLDAVNQIQAGKLDPQVAFMQGQVKMAGDMGFAMQLGMALFM